MEGNSKSMSDMEKTSKSVLLLRSGPEKKEDNYSKLALKHNINLINMPVLTFNFINSVELLNEFNNKHQDYEAVVFTSQRSIEALELIQDEIVEFDANWTRNKLCFVVGEETASKGGFI